MPQQGIELQLHGHLPGAAKQQREDIVASELEFLTDLGFVKWRHRSIGSTRLYQLTSQGVLYLEREEAASLIDL